MTSQKSIQTRVRTIDGLVTNWWNGDYSAPR